MSRLIDADLLKQNCKCTGGFNDNFMCVDLITLAEVIDNQPTAFDTEKVVERLEERKEEVSGCFGVMCSYCKYTEECYEGEKGYKVAFDSAIDIVKKGGVE